MAVSSSIKRFGTKVPDGKRRELKAGAITAMLDSGGLRYIRYHGVEVLRGITYLLRDKNWGTYPAELKNLKVRQTKSDFTVSYDAQCGDSTQSMAYAARIEATTNKIVFRATGFPRTDWLTNRTGFVVLHPLSGIVGAPVEIVHTDGKKQKSRFPKFISPGQPVFEIRSLKHTVMAGVTATVLMEGNKFEMEDHRNWMDASYKTYVCSLLDPWPYTLMKDTPFTQSISVTLEGKPKTNVSAKAAKTIDITVGRAMGRMPQFGVGVPMDESSHALAAADLVAALKPAALVCRIDGRNPKQVEAARDFQKLSECVGSPVTLEIVLQAKMSAAEEMDVIARAVNEGGLKPTAVVVTQMHDLKSFQPNTPRPWGPTYEEMATAARKSFPGIRLGGGMLSYFTELNRKPVPKGLFDFVTHTVCPIVHAADDFSVMETLETLPSIFASTRNMIGKTPYHLGPSSIPCRDNPYGAAVSPNPNNNRICLADMDPRQRGLFAAAWNVGLAAAAVRGELNAVALGATTGPQGVIYRKTGYSQPGFDEASSNKLYPGFAVVRALCSSAGGKSQATLSSLPGKIEAVSWRHGKTQKILVANLTQDETFVKLHPLVPSSQVAILDTGSFSTFIRQPDAFDRSFERLGKSNVIKLGAYAIALVA